MGRACRREQVPDAGARKVANLEARTDHDRGQNYLPAALSARNPHHDRDDKRKSYGGHQDQHLEALSKQHPDEQAQHNCHGR